MSVQNVSNTAPLAGLPQAEMPVLSSPSDNRAQKLWQKMAEGLVKNERSELVGGLKAQHSQHLNWRNRPIDARAKITELFEKLKKREECDWLYSGAAEYNIMGIRETHLIRQMINDLPPTQKEFVIMDMGAGEFQWGRHVMEFINSQTDIRKDITFHIINIRGESYKGEELEEKGQCKIHNLGAFKIEELEKEFKKRGFSLKNSVDFIISRLCFCHLLDPIGTFAQAYNLMRPGKSLFLFDSFDTMREGDTEVSAGKESAKYMTQLLQDLKEPFLKDFGCVLLNRVNTALCKLPMRYFNLLTKVYGNKERLHYKREPQELDKRELAWWRVCKLHGDRTLYDWLTKNFVQILKPNVKYEWESIYEDEARQD